MLDAGGLKYRGFCPETEALDTSVSLSEQTFLTLLSAAERSSLDGCILA